MKNHNVPCFNFSATAGQLDFDPRINYYQRLGLSENASETEIKKAFYSLAKKYHPDSNCEKKQQQASNEEKFKEASNAYEILSDTKKKIQYDEMRREYQQQFSGRSSSSSSRQYYYNGFNDSSNSSAGEHTYKYDSQGRRYGEKPKYEDTTTTQSGSKQYQRRYSDSESFKENNYNSWRKEYEQNYYQQHGQDNQHNSTGGGYQNQQNSGRTDKDYKTYNSYSDYFNQKQKDNFNNFYNERQRQRQEWNDRKHAYNQRNYHKYSPPQNPEQVAYQMMWSFFGFSIFTFIIFGGLGGSGNNKSAQASNANVLPARSTGIPFTNSFSSIEQTYAPYYTPDGRGGHSIFGKVEVKNQNGEIIHEVNKPYDAKQAHTSDTFVAGMGNIEQEYFKRVHKIPKQVQTQLLTPTNSLYDDKPIIQNLKQQQRQSGGVIQNPINEDQNQNKKRKKKNNFRDKQIEAYAKINEQQKIRQKKETMPLKMNNIHKASTRFDPY